MDLREGRGLGRGLEAKGALQHWMGFMPHLLALSGYTYVFLGFRGDGDPLRKLDLEPRRDQAAM